METNGNVPFAEFIELDNSAKEMLGAYYEWLQSDQGISPEEASPMAHAADRYLRDFVVDIMAVPPSETSPALVRAYLGNWYPIHTLTPTLEEVALIAKALELLHTQAALTGTIAKEHAEQTTKLLSDPAYFKKRLQEFWDLTPDAIDNWRQADDYREMINAPKN
jgi:hypothetical protein